MPRRPSGKRITLPDGTVQVRGKNANGDGSVYASPNGTWRATWYDRTGKIRYVRGRTRAAVLEKRTALIAEDRAAPTSTVFNKNTTLAELSDWWLDNVASQRVRRSSLGKYRDRVARMKADLGDTPVVDLRPEGVAAWLAGLSRSGLAPSTVRDMRATLRQVLGQAEEYGLVAGNAAMKVRPPKIEQRGRRALSVDDARALLEAAKADPLGAAVWLLFVQGWRVSEVLGLSWDDVDLKKSTATVRRACVYVDGEGRCSAHRRPRVLPARTRCPRVW